MIHRDTVCLLRECDAGLRMGVASIDDVLEHVRSDDFREALCACRSAHERLGEDIRAALGRFGDEGKAPNAMARGMAWLKTRAELAVSPTDATAAKLIRDGCEMGAVIWNSTAPLTKRPRTSPSGSSALRKSWARRRARSGECLPSVQLAQNRAFPLLPGRACVIIDNIERTQKEREA